MISDNHCCRSPAPWIGSRAKYLILGADGIMTTHNVEDSGEGRWTVLDALEKDVPAPVITLSLMARLRSRQKNTFSGRVLAALRNEFGGHAIKKA